MGIVLKRAKYFITCSGKYFIDKEFMNASFIERNLILEDKQLLETKTQQLSLF